MKKYLILFIAALGAVTSCITPFDPDYDETPVIYVVSYPGSSPDHIDIMIQPAYSRSNTAEMPTFKPEIDFKVNGKSVPVESRNVTEGIYRVNHVSKPGDCMEISVVSEGFEGVWAETYIPETFPDHKIDYRKVYTDDDSYDNVLYVTISDIKPDYGYGVQLHSETIYEYPSEPKVNMYRYAGKLYPLNDDLDELTPITLDAVDIELSGDYLWAWEGVNLVEGDNTFAIMPQTYGYVDLDSYDSFFVQQGKTMTYDEYGNELGIVEYIKRNKLILYTMSSEFYKYKVASEYQSDYDGFLGFVAPTNYCYSNVENGYGVFAGICIVETDWITKEFIENNR